jgi:hypothetical protein
MTTVPKGSLPAVALGADDLKGWDVLLDSLPMKASRRVLSRAKRQAPMSAAGTVRRAAANVTAPIVDRGAGA